jgi:hypothetical protein
MKRNVTKYPTIHPVYRDIEEWKLIPNTEGMYEASSWGRVRSVDRVVDHSTSGKLHLKGKMLRFCVSNENYFYVTICIKAKRVKYNVHVLIAAAFYGPRPEGHHVDHHDRNRQNNHINNLSYKTILENCSFKGTQSGSAKLTEKQVSEIKAKYKPKIYTTVMLGQEYNVDPTTIHKITSGLHWKHVQPAKLT